MTLLLAQNEKIFKESFGEERYSTLDTVKIQTIRASGNFQADLDGWKSSDYKAIVAADITPRDHDLYLKYRSHLEEYEIGKSIKQYINDIESDPHLYLSACTLRETIEEIGADPDLCQTSLSHTDVLIILDPGNGEALNFIIEQAKPTYIFCYVDCWESFVASFEHTDWTMLSERYGLENFFLARYDSIHELVSKVSSIGLPFLDHAYIYYPKMHSERTLESAKYLTSKSTTNQINYTGFTNDEYNMIYNSSHMLSQTPKVFSPPECQVAKNILICGSGPSLDDSIEVIRRLQSSHLIIAAASSFATLIKHGITPDILCILERGQFLYNDYKGFVSKEVSQHTLLVTSSVCDYKLAQLFEKRVVFFRPSLTPVSIYSTAPSQCLPLDGPQAVNTAVSLAASLKPDHIALIGCDLGTMSLDKVRSSSAAGVSPRTFDRKIEANFGGECWTDAFMQDAIIQLNGQLTVYTKPKFFNLSNGAKITGASSFEPSSYLSQYMEKTQDSVDQSSSVDSWYSEMRIYESRLAKMLWNQGDFRHSIALVIGKILTILESDDPFGHNSTQKISKIFDMDNIPRHRQLAQRILRGFVIKTWISLRRQHIIMHSNGQEYLIPRFDKSSKDKLAKMLILIEGEIYELCDEIDLVFDSY